MNGDDARELALLPRLPKAYRLKQELLKLVRHMPAGWPMPSERALAERYSVSRATVRQALQDLMFEGRLHRLQGRGTFVSRPKLTQTLQLTSHTREMETSGLVPSSAVLGSAEVDADEEVARFLELEGGGRVWHIERLRLANGEPMALESLFASAERFPELGDRMAGSTSFYGLLRDVYGVELARGEETIECILASPAAASLLGIEPRSPMLKLTRRSWDRGGRVVEYVESLYRGDRYRFVSPLELPEQSEPS
jgi:GntR family transcriptional regulator